MAGRHFIVPEWAAVEEYTNDVGQPCYRLLGGPNLVEVENARPSDEAFYRDDLGVINVTKALSLIPAKAQPTRRPLNAEIRAHIVENDFDPAVLARMSHQRMREPVLLMMSAGRAYLIDGTHRLNKRIELGKDWFPAFLLTEAALPICLVRQFIVQPDGTRVEYQEQR